MAFSVDLPPDFLDLPVERAARLVAIDLFKQADHARARLVDPNDTEALHDFRVSLRRFRSWVRGYRPYLSSSVRGRIRRRLKAVAAATSEARDTCVQLSWLSASESTMDQSQRVGALHLRRRLERRLRDAEKNLHQEVARDFARAADVLVDTLPVYTIRARVDEPPGRAHPIAAAAADLLVRGAQTLRERLRRVRSVDDQALAHDARIEGKRLRYLLEPLSAHVEAAAPLIATLKALQDVIGELHDAHVLSREVLMEAESSSPTDVARPGIIALAAALRDRELLAYAELERDWLAGSDYGRDLFEAIHAIAADLLARATRDTEIERKYLLHGLPAQVQTATAVEIEQGYLPGARLAERLRRVRRNDDISYYRTVKLGTGISRTEVEEEAQPDVFDTMWPLTEGRRLHKRRYEVPDGLHTWEIDEFTDRELVLAEIELTDADTLVSPPDWLAPYVVREVTGEPEFLNINLAG